MVGLSASRKSGEAPPPGTRVSRVVPSQGSWLHLREPEKAKREPRESRLSARLRTSSFGGAEPRRS